MCYRDLICALAELDIVSHGMDIDYQQVMYAKQHRWTISICAQLLYHAKQLFTEDPDPKKNCHYY